MVVNEKSPMIKNKLKIKDLSNFVEISILRIYIFDFDLVVVKKVYLCFLLCI